MASLFVYGTLRRPVGGPPADSHFHHRIADGISAVRSATLPDAQLFDLGSYPGLGRGRSVVVGELFEVAPSILEATDEIEGHPEFYVREIETIRLADGETKKAWVYWAPESLLTDALVISSGDWFDRPRGLVISPAMDDQLADDKYRISTEAS